MSAGSRPRKRAAFESPARLARPVAGDPGMRRPMTTVAGGVLVMLRVVAGIVWMMAVTFDWKRVSGEFDLAIGGLDLSEDERSWGLGVLWLVVGAMLLADLVLAVFILLGRNWPRVIVMVLSTISIASSFAAWWAQGQEIHVSTTLLTLSFDILVLLALSSRSAAAYARRFERR
ncbi:hypothetical protein [Microbacterium sp. 18062]|uniref:hypothetical protein n=1 Tax=Microbacterium sp. 18062 TaxID=2681410 RepID=UPI00135A7AB0|nr:hypothetical protein [Microbacterium sp. 18062]